MTLAANALTTLATVLDELSLTTDGGVVDARLERYINAASDLIERYCGRTFQREDAIAELVAPKGGAFLLLERTPVLSIASIMDDGTTIDAAEYELRDADVGNVYRAAGWPSTARSRGGLTSSPVPGSEERTLTVTYSAGYVTPAQAADADGDFFEATRTLPYDLEDACVQMVTTRWLARGVDLRLRQKAYENATMTFGGTPIPPEIMGVLDSYARIASA